MAYGVHAVNDFYKSKVLVIGSDVLAQYVLAGVIGLGVREGVCVMDNKRINRSDKNDFLFIKENKKIFNIGQEKVTHIDKTLRKINSTANILPRHSKFTEAYTFRFSPDIIVDATNDCISKECAIDYALNYRVPLISVSTDNEKGIVSMYKPSDSIKLFKENIDLEKIVHREFEGKSQGNFTSSIIAGLIVEEIRKYKFKFNQYDKNIENNFTLVYNINSKTRKGFKSDLRLNNKDFSKYNLLIVGAGGTGTYVALSSTLLGIGNIDIIDKDTVEEHNLNRQILFYDAIGEPKAEVLCKRLKEINPKVNFNFSVKELKREDERLFKYGNKLSKYDLIFGCVDNREARLILDEFSVRYNIPYIDGGLDPKSGQVAVYVPGRTPRVTKQTTFPKGSVSCADRTASVIMSNMIIGSAMVGEGVRILNINNCEENSLGFFTYDIFNDERISFKPLAVSNK